jgi:uncharacterized protein (TIGR00369 family)
MTALPTPTPRTRAGLHAVLPDDREAEWLARFGRWHRPFFPNVLGLELLEVRDGYARMRLPHRPDLDQPAGVTHGGAIASLIDTSVVPAVASPYPQVPVLLTVDMQVRYLGAARDTDLTAEGWVTKRGRSIVFCQSEVRADGTGELVADGWLVYRIITRDTIANGGTP